jgi:hypothetical protein
VIRIIDTQYECHTDENGTYKNYNLDMCWGSVYVCTGHFVILVSFLYYSRYI